MRVRFHLLLALFVPPLAMALAHRPRQILPNTLLTLLGWLPGVIHAIRIVIEVVDHQFLACATEAV